ncbi:hypothetical protein [Pimelobacter simplex]|uniref:hypothetical protein n=1 Tax=Nocardioides simplex TaxID=2045 RepID=UPI0019315729|nr:hypothetical protein [Pimelobacter simplex]
MSWTQTRSALALAKRDNPDADVTDLRRQLKAERLEEYVNKVVSEAPPLTREQRDRIARLLLAGGGADAA